MYDHVKLFGSVRGEYDLRSYTFTLLKYCLGRGDSTTPDGDGV